MQTLKYKILVLNGPNLNLLGVREPGIYGATTLDAICQKLTKRAELAGIALEAFQSNSESALINRIHAAAGFTKNSASTFENAARAESAKSVESAKIVDAIIFNPAAFTHTSIALRDALLAVKIPFVEVHLSNIFGRDAFRKISYFSDIAEGVVSGFGAKSYDLALEFFIQKFSGAE